MRKGLVSFIIVLCILIFLAVSCQNNPANSDVPVATQSQTTAPDLPVLPNESNTDMSPDSSEQSSKVDAVDTESPNEVPITDANSAVQEAEPEVTETPITESPRETDPPAIEEPEHTEPKPTQPRPTEPSPTTPAPTEPTPTEPPITEPPVTDPISTDPPPTESVPTEPAGCIHEWICVHHNAEGHWRAGIVCDCGWTVYGNPSELVSMWNAHSASYPPAESLFDHGGYGSADEWIIDEPAYDEWICKHCGEPRP